LARRLRNRARRESGLGGSTSSKVGLRDPSPGVPLDKRASAKTRRVTSSAVPWPQAISTVTAAPTWSLAHRARSRERIRNPATYSLSRVWRYLRGGTASARSGNAVVKQVRSFVGKDSPATVGPRLVQAGGHWRLDWRGGCEPSPSFLHATHPGGGGIQTSDSLACERLFSLGWSEV